MNSHIYYFQNAGVIFKVYTYSYRSNIYYMRECFKNGAFYQVSAAYMREKFPAAFSIIKDKIGTRKYMGV